MKKFCTIFFLYLLWFVPQVFGQQIPANPEFSNNGYRLVFGPQVSTVAGREITFSPAQGDSRDLYLLLSSEQLLLTTPGTGITNSGWVQNASSVLLGQATLSSMGSRYGIATVLPPNGESGGWYYVVLAAKNTIGGYDALIVGSTPIQFGEEAKIYYTPFTENSFVSKNGRTEITGGPIDTARHLNFKSFTISFQYVLKSDATAPGFSEDPAVTLPGALPVEPNQGIALNSTKGIANDGKYYFNIGNLTKNAAYYFRQIITAPSGAYAVQTGTFYNDNRGMVPPGSVKAQDDFERRSYRLLAPLPGLAVLLDPSLCFEKNIENPGGGQICSINDFLNYVFRLLIGASAVILVVRLIIEGLRYMTTDVPFLKINAKSKIGQAALGLALALSAWVILNTINPKLVENNISIQGITLQLEDYGDIDAPTLSPTGQLPQGVYCPGQGKGSAVQQIAESWQGKVVYFLNGSKKDGTASHRGKDPSAFPDGKARLDCSGFVNTVLSCAGYSAGADYINSGTARIFQNAEEIKSGQLTDTSVNGVVLKPGDLLGWTGSPYGHVIIYIGNGKVMESVRKSVNPAPPVALTSYANVSKLKYVKRIPG